MSSADPEFCLARAAFWDWAEENGLPYHQGLRLMGDRWPARSAKTGLWVWWKAVYEGEKTSSPVLPGPVWEKLESFELVRHGIKRYNGLMEALFAAARAFQLLGESSEDGTA